MNTKEPFKMPRKRVPFLECVRRDFAAALENDPAAHGPLAKVEVALSYPGFHAILLHRITHEVHRFGVPLLPKLMSMLNRFLTGIEIHQAARIGPGFFIDHGMGVVIGETAVVGEDCMLFHQVTLGGTGKATGKRHPTLLNGVVVGAGAKILGNITIGNHCYVGANSVVLKDVPDNSTVVGIPGRVVARDGKKIAPASHPLDHNLPDPILDRLRALESRLEALEGGRSQP
jgi:serine O-acetyltransferase